MGALVLAALILATFGGSLWIRRRLGRSIDHAYCLKLSAISAGIGSSAVGVFYPLVYVLVSRGWTGGTIAANLPPGVTEDALLGLAVLGGVVIALGAVYGLLEYLRS